MHLLDWAVVVAYLVWIVWDGLRRSKATNEVEGYFLANRSLPWWAVGLSVMATQLSAITLVGTTGRGYADGLSIVQLYLGLPIAMVILSVTRRAVLLPREGVHGLRVPRAALRREDAHAGEPPVPAVARAVVRRHHRGAGRDPVDRARLEPDAHHPRHRPADRALHDGRRRAGGDVDRREADGRHRRRASARRSSCCCSSCPTTCRSGRRCTSRARPAGCRPSTSRGTRTRRTRSGRGSSAACS